VLDTIDTSLMPDAKNEELKKMLEEIRPKIEGHLKAAEELKTALAAAPAEPAKPAAGGAKAPAGGAAPAAKTPEKK
jgi:rubrerythrin